MLAVAALSSQAFAPIAPLSRAGPVSMKAPGEIGVTQPLGVYDPLNLLATPVTYPRKSYERYVELEIKHGRIAMLATLGVITTEAGFRWPGYLSKSLDLKFSDIPGGALTSYAAVPAIGWRSSRSSCSWSWPSAPRPRATLPAMWAAPRGSATTTRRSRPSSSTYAALPPPLRAGAAFPQATLSACANA